MSELKTTETKPNDGEDYRSKVAKAYDGEIFGAAFFAALADRFEDRRKQIEIMRDIELATAERMVPVVSRLKLPPSDTAKLESDGRKAASRVTEWTAFIESFRKAAPGFVAEFEALAAVAPAQDRAVAAFLVAHEVAFVSFTEKESAGEANATAALEELLQKAR
jgi:hypothetical protein